MRRRRALGGLYKPTFPEFEDARQSVSRSLHIKHKISLQGRTRPAMSRKLSFPITFMVESW